MKRTEDIEVYGKHFSPEAFWRKISRHARRLGARTLYLALVLYYAWNSPDLATKDRRIIIGALGYLILPLDLIPDLVPFTGYADDLAALTIAVYRVIRHITPEVRAQAEARLREILGDVDSNDLRID